MKTNQSFDRVSKGLNIILTWLVLTIILVFLQIMVTQIYWEFSRVHQLPARQQQSMSVQQQKLKEIDNAQKEFTPEGRLYLVHEMFTPGRFDAEKTIRITDPNGRLVYEGPQDEQPLDFIQWQPANRNSYSNQQLYESALRRLDTIGTEFSRYLVIPVVNDQNERIAHWIFDDDRQIFKGFSISGQPLGFIGAAGFSTDSDQSRPFGKSRMMDGWLRPGTVDPLLLYQSPDAVYQIDFKNRRVETLLQTDNERLGYVRQNNWKELPDCPNRPLIFAVTESGRLYIRLKKPDRLIQTQTEYTPMVAAVNDRIWLKTTEIPSAPNPHDQEKYREWLDKHRHEPFDYKVTLYQLKTDGILLQENAFTWTRQVPEGYIARSENFRTAVNAVSSPVPVWLSLPFRDQLPYHTASQWNFVFQTLGFVSQYRLPLNLGVMALLALLTYLHGRPRFNSRWQLAAWIVFVFLFNLAGFLTYLALNHTAVMRCAHCGKRRGLAADTCPCCNAPLPQPKQNPTDLVRPLSS